MSASPVRHNARLAFQTEIRDALSNSRGREASVRRVLRRHRGPALSFLSRSTLRRLLLALGYTAAVATAATHWPSPPRGGAQAFVATPAGNATVNARSWAQRAWNAAPSRTRIINVVGAGAAAANPLLAIRWITASVTSRSIDAVDRQIVHMEASVNKARAQIDMYVSWTIFIAFLAVISHFIPPIVRNVRRTVNVLLTGNAEQVLTLAGNTTRHALEAPRARGRSRSRSRSRSRQVAARTLRIGAGAPVKRLTLPASVQKHTVRRLPTNTELLARLG